MAGVIFLPSLRASTSASLGVFASPTLTVRFRRDLIPATSFFALDSVTAIFSIPFVSRGLPGTPVVELLC
ncbi:unannotated protein [freshwater metagenome]|uniref:Unannotated protein n=1 Tax=freshwater metagenome TaxID=449393 RepID=A0A6J6IWQ8_9ZZZZ